MLGGHRDHLVEMRDARRDLLHDTRSVSRCNKETAIYLGCFSRLYAFIHEVRKCDYVVLTIWHVGSAWQRGQGIFLLMSPAVRR